MYYIMQIRVYIWFMSNRKLLTFTLCVARKKSRLRVFLKILFSYLPGLFWCGAPYIYRS